MDLFARAEAEKSAKEELEKRRKLRIVQVRKQTTDWMTALRKNYETEKSHQVEKIINEASDKREKQLATIIEEIGKFREENIKEIGTAHRAADLENQMEYDKKDQFERIQNEKTARNRHMKALKEMRGNIMQENETTSKQLQLKQKIRQNEDLIAKELVITRPYGASVRTKEAEVQDGKAYQQSPTKYLHVPSEAKEPRLRKKKLTKRRGMLKEKQVVPTPVMKPVKVLPSVFGLVADDRASGTVPAVIRKRHPACSCAEHLKMNRMREKGGGDVTFFDAGIPRPPQRYKAPPGLVERDREVTKSSAWAEGAKLNEEIQKVQSQNLLSIKERERRAELRGKKAIRIARLEQRYKQLECNLLEKDQLQSFQPVLGSSKGYSHSVLGLDSFNSDVVPNGTQSSTSSTMFSISPKSNGSSLRTDTSSNMNSTKVSSSPSSTIFSITPKSNTSNLHSDISPNMNSTKLSSSTIFSITPKSNLSNGSSLHSYISSSMNSSNLPSSSTMFSISPKSNGSSCLYTDTSSTMNSSSSTMALIYLKCSPKKKSNSVQIDEILDSSLSDILNTQQLFNRPSSGSTITSDNSKEMERASFGINVVNVYQSSVQSEQPTTDFQSTTTSSAIQKLTEEWAKVSIDKPSWL